MQLSESDWSLCCQRPNGKIAKSDLDGRDVALSVSHSVEGMSEYFIFLILSSAELLLDLNPRTRMKKRATGTRCTCALLMYVEFSVGLERFSLYIK